jgi:Uncharacterised nucleotidyltransferase
MSMSKHRILSSSAQEWLLRLADPLARRPVPSAPLRVDVLAALFEAAPLQGVLPALVRNLRALADREGQGFFADANAENYLRQRLVESERSLSAQCAFQDVLVRESKRLGDALAAAKIPFAMVKGEVFARRLYPTIEDRPFDDIDVLVRSDDLDRAGPVLGGLGYRRTNSTQRGAVGSRLDEWILDREQRVVVELQSELVRSRKLGAALTLTYNELIAAGNGDPEDPSALLLVAALHGAAIHQFERLQHLVDVLQAVRGTAGPIQIDRLKEGARLTGSTLPVQAALDLTAAMFSEPAARELAGGLAPSRWRRLRQRLITGAVLLRARSRGKKLDSWRRRMLRSFIKNAGSRERRSSVRGN